MKNILCYGDSNSWGLIPGKFNETYKLQTRLPPALRWPRILQKLLGSDYYVIEENLNGRNTSFDEKPKTRPSRNGLATLPGILEMHYPLDLVIFMLGTNDTRIDFNFNASVEDIVQGMQSLVHYVKESHLGKNFQAPKVLLIAPAPLIPEAAGYSGNCFDASSIQKSKEIPAAYQQLAEKEQCAFIDAGTLVEVDPADGVHIKGESLSALAKAVTDKILTMKW